MFVTLAARRLGPPGRYVCAVQRFDHYFGMVVKVPADPQEPYETADFAPPAIPFPWGYDVHPDQT